MIKPFLDANLLVAVLNKEYPAFTAAARVLSLAGQKGFVLYTSPLCLADKKVGDLEDRLEYNAAEKAGCTHLLTNDTGDYHFARLPVYTPEAFLREIIGRNDLFA